MYHHLRILREWCCEPTKSGIMNVMYRTEPRKLESFIPANICIFCSPLCNYLWSTYETIVEPMQNHILEVFQHVALTRAYGSAAAVMSRIANGAIIFSYINSTERIGFLCVFLYFERIIVVEVMPH